MAVRGLRRSPGFAAAAIAALALGIGANSAVFSFVDAVVLQRPPFRDPARIVTVWEESSRRPGQHNVVSPANFVRWRERVRTLEPLAVFVDARATITGGDNPEEVVVQTVTAPFFPTLGVPPLIGRTFSDAEYRDGAGVIVLGHALWQRRYGGDPSIVGRTIQFNGKPTAVVGVMPPGFSLYVRAGGGAGKAADLWAPYVLPANAADIANRSPALT